MNQNKEIPAGYKDSQLGIIPKDWQVKKLDELGIFLKGKGITKDKIKSSGNPCLTYGDIYTKYNFVVKNIKSFIDDSAALESQKIEFGDILFAGSGETIEDIGKCVAYIDKEIAFAGGDIIIFKPYESESITLSYLLNSSVSNKQKYKFGQGHSIVHIYPFHLKKIEIVLPTLPEQKKIAEILFFWDKAIEKQEQLVEKLERRKRGLMRQLLSGEIRLHGLVQNWGVVKLGNIGSTYNGLTGKTKEDFGTGQPFITYMNVFSSPKTAMKLMDFVMIDKNDNQNKVQYGDILFTISSETPDEVGMSSVLLDDAKDTYLNSFCFGYRLFDFNVLLPEFAQYYFRSSAFRSYMYKLAQGSTRFNLSKTEVLKLNLKLPTIREQITIAQILSATDKEVGCEKDKLSLFHIQKKALTQQLLNGRIRVSI